MNDIPIYTVSAEIEANNWMPETNVFIGVLKPLTEFQIRLLSAAQAGGWMEISGYIIDGMNAARVLLGRSDYDPLPFVVEARLLTEKLDVTVIPPGKSYNAQAIDTQQGIRCYTLDFGK